MEDTYVPASMHLQLQKIGRSERDKQQIIKSLASHQEYEQIQELNVVGLDLNVMQNQAIHAIQTLLSETGFEGNLPPFHCSAEGFGQTDLPVMKFSPAEYYKAFDLKRHKVKSGYDQYYGGDCKQALSALKSLYSRQFVIKFNHKTFSDKKNQSLRGSVCIYEKLFYNVVEDYQINAANRTVLKSIKMILSPVFVFQREKYIVMKPVGYIRQIKEVEPRASKFVHSFIEFVLYQSHFEHKNDIIRRQEESLAYQLRMDGLIKNRKWQEIRKIIRKCLEVAKAIEFITEFSIADKRIEFKINFEKLVRVDNKFK
jgi:hypothetical protein